MVDTKEVRTKKLLTTKEAARILHINENMLRKWCDQGILTAFRVGWRGDLRLLDSDVNTLNMYLRGNHSHS